MNEKLDELRKVKGEQCVSIILNTHRTAPDNKKDSIILKNLVKETEDRLMNSVDKKKAQEILESIKELEASIDHNQNLESLILFVNNDENIAEYIRLPISVIDRVIIGDTFATRDLIRAKHLNAGYYVLLLSQSKIRMIQAQNHEVVEEMGDPFPIENTDLYTTSGIESSNANRVSNLTREFFNRADKDVNDVRKKNALPVLICTEEENFSEYLKIADDKESIFEEHMKGNMFEEKAAAIVKEAWPIVKQQVRKRNESKIKNLETALGTGNYLSDINEIRMAIKEGKVKTLYVQEGLFQPAVMENGSLQLLSSSDEVPTDAIDDIYDDLIEQNMEFGGDAVFLPEGNLEKFNGFAAVTRY